jgi:hypothetical protein
MRKMSLSALVLFCLGVALAAMGCASMNSMGLAPDSKSYEPDFPASNYSIGQIVEMSSLQGKVNVVYTPSIPVDQESNGEGSDVSSDKLKSLSTKLAAKIEEIIADNLTQVGSDKVTVTVSGVATQSVPKFTIYRHLLESFHKNPDLLSMTKRYGELGTRFHVITRVTVANVSFTVTDPLGKEATLDPEIVKTINARLNTDFRQSKDRKTCSGEDLVLSFEADPKMVPSLVQDSKK